MVQEIKFPKRIIETLEKLRAHEWPEATLDQYLSAFYGVAVHVVAED